MRQERIEPRFLSILAKLTQELGLKINPTMFCNGQQLLIPTGNNVDLTSMTLRYTLLNVLISLKIFIR